MAHFVGCVADVSPLFDPRGNSGILVGVNPFGLKRQTGTNPRKPIYEPIDPYQGQLWVPGRGGHALSFGMTRSGKGLQIISALLQYYASVVVIDPKGENAWTTAPRRRQLGNRVVILDPFDEVNRRYGARVGVKEQTTRFNPLSVIDPRSPDYAEDLMMLADSIIITTNAADPHWPESARALVAGLMAAAIENSPPGMASFRSVRKLLTAPDKDLADAVVALHARNPDSLAGRLLRRFTVGGKEIRSIRSTADTQTAIFEAARLLDSMETDANAFDLSELATRRVSLFLVLPVDRLQTYGRWLRMILMLSIRAITRHPIPPDPPVLFMLDELGTINPGGGLRMIETAYGLMAGMGIRIWGFLQDINQLQHDYPNSWQTFIANSEMVQLLKINDNNTSEYFSRKLGESPNGFGGGNGRRYMRPESLEGLEADRQVLLFAGGNSYIMRKVNYLTDHRFNGMYRPNPLFPSRPLPAAPPAPVVQTDPVYDPLASFITPEMRAKAAELGKQAAKQAADWAKTDGKKHAEAAAAAAAQGAAKASAWASGKFAAFKARNAAPSTDTPESDHADDTKL